MLRRRLDPERHGSAGFTSAHRLASIGFVVAFFALGTHLVMKSWYDGRIMPGVVVAGYNLSGLTLPQARDVVRGIGTDYKLKLTVADQRYELTAAQLGVTFDTEATIQSAYNSGRDSWLPPLHHDPLPLSYRLDRVQLNAFTNSVAEKVGTPPIDAGVVVRGTQLTTVPEKSGWSIDRVGLQRLIEDDIRSPGNAGLLLKPREQLADIQANSLAPTLAAAKHHMATPIILTYADKTFTPTSAEIGQWLAFQKQPDGTKFKLVTQVDIAKLKRYIQSVANQIDVAAVVKKVNVENGVSKVTQEGVDGLAIDRDPLTNAINNAVVEGKPLTFAITTHVVPFKTVTTNLITLDYPKYIEVNLTKQRLWVWQDKNVIYESPITSGAVNAGFATATGLFSIYYKTTNTRLRGYQYGWDYDVPVKYWMPFYGGYGLHDAVWRGGVFGGQDYIWNGSHGCVNLPDATAEFIYNWAEIGTPVWVHK